MSNPEEEGKQKTKQKDKLQMLKEQTRVYVGETSRSIFERAGDHQQAAAAGQEDSHMMKHLTVTHPELQDPPKFIIRVVASFQDAMSSQLIEAVRIDLRGENVLNSKSEYSRCKVPKLVINRDEWSHNDGLKKKKDALVDNKKVEDDSLEMENALLSGGAAWDIGTKGTAKKRRSANPESKAKKKKMENLVGWGK